MSEPDPGSREPRVVPVTWLVAPTAIVALGFGWLMYRNAQLDDRVSAMESTARPSSAPSPATSATAATATTSDPPAPEPAPKTFGELDTKAVLATWEAALPRIRLHCGEHDSGKQKEVQLMLRIDHRGGVLTALPKSNSPLDTCVAEMFAQFQFPDTEQPTAGVVALPWTRAADDGAQPQR